MPRVSRSKQNTAQSSIKLNYENLENNKDGGKKTENEQCQNKKRKNVKDSGITTENGDGESEMNYDNEENGEEYEVDKIIDQRLCKGHRQFLVRWKGYTEEFDTWESETDLNCDRLINEYLAIQGTKSIALQVENTKTKFKAVKKKKLNKQKSYDNGKSKEIKFGENEELKIIEDVADESKEYEVEKIIEVYFKKDKKREFLIRWKGFTSNYDTWEPEENLNCQEIIEKFMKKLHQIKSIDNHDLRVNPTHTKRYTLTMYGDKRQSRRNANKERVSYFECDE